VCGVWCGVERSAMLSASMPAAHAARDQKTRICGRGWLALNLAARPPNCLCLGLCHHEAKVPSHSSLALPFDCFTSRPQHVSKPSLDLPMTFPRLAHLLPPVHDPFETIVNTDHSPAKGHPSLQTFVILPGGMRNYGTDAGMYH
jgi:hypothetical protein